jgi:hypothetical protein
MLFEEFFKKKKINLQTFEQGEPGLFSEFKIHYEEMGEKSFDHTKKYWFNKLRLRFPAPIEPKVEKEIIENRLAEQTITESLVESSTPTPKVGFKPMFRAGAKPVAPEPEKKEETTITEPAETPAPAPAVGFKPRFKAGVTKPVEPQEEPKAEEAPKEENTDQPKPAVGFKPRFKAGVTKPAVIESEKEESTTAPPDTQAPSVGFKPRFKAGITKPAVTEEPKVEEIPKEEDKEPSKPALGFKPKFRPGTKPPEE